MASHLSLSLLLLIFSRLSGAYRVSVKTGGSITIPCPYDEKYKTHVKYWCKVHHLYSCSPVVPADPPKSTDKVSISYDINWQTTTLTMTDLEPVDSGRYYCDVEINSGQIVWVAWLDISVTPGTPELYVDQQEVTGVEGGSVIVNCYYSNTGNIKVWCRIGGSVPCVERNYRNIDGTSVTLQQTTDATRGNILTVTMNGLKMENTGWYMCGGGDLMMPVHITVRQQTTTQSTTTMTTTQAPTTEQSSFSPTAEPVQTDNTVQGPEGDKEKDPMSSIDLKALLIPLGMLVVVMAGVLVTWKMWRKHKDNKATDQTRNTSVNPFPDNGDDVTYSTVVTKRRNQLNVQTKVEPDDNVVYSSLALQLDPFPAKGDDDVTYSSVVPKWRNHLYVQTEAETDDNVVYSSLAQHHTEGSNTAVTD